MNEGILKKDLKFVNFYERCNLMLFSESPIASEIGSEVIRILAELTVVGALASWTVPGDHRLLLPRRIQQLLNPHLSASTLSWCDLYTNLQRGKGLQTATCAPPTQPPLRCVQNVSLFRYEDTYNMDQSPLREALVA